MTIFMSAAEASGDERGAELIGALRRRLPQVRIVGAAGPKMAEAGCEVLADLTRHATMMWGALPRLGFFIRAVRRLQEAIRRIRPDVHVPVDSPAINWHLASTAKLSGASVVYYVAPQVWAWAPWRVRKLARLTDHVACILPFEERFLQSRGVRATYVGHPLFDTLPDRPDPPPDLSAAYLDGSWQVALLPGSRIGEIRDHAPALLKVSEAIRSRWAKANCVFIAHTQALADAIRSACGEGKGAQLEIAVGQTRQILAQSHFAVAKSGTITLELAHFGVPMVTFYHVGKMFRTVYRVMGQWAVPTPMFSLVNILAGRRIVPELIPWRGDPARLKNMVLEVMDDLGYLLDARQMLLKVTEPLRAKPPASASGNTAELICRVLQERS